MTSFHLIPFCVFFLESKINNENAHKGSRNQVKLEQVNVLTILFLDYRGKREKKPFHREDITLLEIQ